MKKGFGKWLFDAIKVNGDAKALAIILTIVIFYSIRATIGNRETFTVPVNVAVGAGVAILEQEPRNVTITFEGSRAELRRLADEKIVAEVVPSSGVSNEMIPIRARNISARHIARVASIEPSFVRVRYDRESKVVMPVAPPVAKGNPLRGQVSFDYKPRAVEVTGPQRQMAHLLASGFQVQAEPIDVEGRVQSFTRMVNLLPPDDVVVSSIKPESLEVRVTIETKVHVAEVPNVPVRVAASPLSTESFAFTPTNVAVRLSGRKEVLDAFDRSSLIAFILCPDKPVPASEVPVRVYLPPGDESISVDAAPASVRILPSATNAVPDITE